MRPFWLLELLIVASCSMERHEPDQNVMGVTRDVYFCAGTAGTVDDRMAACTRAIQSGKLSPAILSKTFYARAEIWWHKGDIDGEIADLSEAIRLNPHYANAFNNRGSAWTRKQDVDRAIADLNEAIRLGPSYPPGAYNNRGIAWGDMGDDDRAIADYDEAIRLDPQYAAAFNDRGGAWCKKSDSDRAIADYDQAIRLDPKLAKAYENRGICKFLNGLFGPAAYDFNEAVRLDTRNPYFRIWRYLAQARGGAVSIGKSELSSARSTLDESKWPAPVIDLLLGHLDPSTLLTAAKGVASETERAQVCEAHFFLGEFYVLGAQPANARENLAIATQTCPKSETQYFAAAAELKRIS